MSIGKTRLFVTTAIFLSSSLIWLPEPAQSEESSGKQHITYCTGKRYISNLKCSSERCKSWHGSYETGSGGTLSKDTLGNNHYSSTGPYYDCLRECRSDEKEAARLNQIERECEANRRKSEGSASTTTGVKKAPNVDTEGASSHEAARKLNEALDEDEVKESNRKAKERAQREIERVEAENARARQNEAIQAQRRRDNEQAQRRRRVEEERQQQRQNENTKALFELGKGIIDNQYPNQRPAGGGNPGGDYEGCGTGPNSGCR